MGILQPGTPPEAAFCFQLWCLKAAPSPAGGKDMLTHHCCTLDAGPRGRGGSSSFCRRKQKLFLVLAVNLLNTVTIHGGLISGPMIYLFVFHCICAPFCPVCQRAHVPQAWGPLVVAAISWIPGLLCGISLYPGPDSHTRCSVHKYLFRE